MTFKSFVLGDHTGTYQLLSASHERRLFHSTVPPEGGGMKLTSLIVNARETA